ncbi:MAG: apolipoprotein N-acyltransferase [Crocinitomicaceae bacterium]|nr:apolipoprotein N-acyltransferase [Crocinitomicaceae bacterium]
MNKCIFAVMEIRLPVLFLLAILGGLMLGLSFPFTGSLFPLAFIAFIPLMLINVQLNKFGKGRFWIRFLLNYLYFLIYNTVTTWWIYYASAEGVYMAVFANSLLMTLPFFFAAFIMRRLGENKGLLAILVFWLSFEYLHFYWELSWPWLNLGHILGNQIQLIQWYEFSGVTGGSLWIIFINILGYIIIRNLRIRKENLKIQTPVFLFLGLGIIIPVISSLTIFYTYEEKNDPVDIVVAQPNIEAHFEKYYTPWEMQLTKMFRFADPLTDENVDLVVCPETAINIGMDEKMLDRDTLKPLLFVESFQKVKHNVPVLIGATTQLFFREENSAASRPFGNFWYEDYNTALLLDSPKPIQFYHKSKLVLGSEKLPFVGMFPFLKKYSVELGGTSGILGTGEEPEIFEASGVKFAPVICYESVYGEYVSYYIRKGAEIITVITNDGWWQDTPGYKQHRMFSQIRAIECRRSVARSANTGVSCFINQKGEIISEIGCNRGGAIRASINRNSEFTFFVKYGDVTGRISLFVALIMLVFAVVHYFKSLGIRTSTMPK